MTKVLRLRKAFQPLTWVFLCLISAILVILLYVKSPFVNLWREQSPEWIHVTSRASLVHAGSNDSFAITQDGIQAGKLVLDLLENNNADSGKVAIQMYNRLIPVENYGGEYSALQWFCEYVLAPESEKKKMLSDKYVASFYDFFAANNFAPLKEYLKRKYKLGTIGDEETQTGQNRMALLEDTILFNNPKREEWEKTTKVIDFIKLKPGERVADIGSGPGYNTFKFAELVGDKGRVYAIDMVQEHLNYVDRISKKYGVQNVETVNNTPGNTIGLSQNQQVDVAYMCSLYHNIYAMSRESERDQFVESIKNSLTKNGRFILADNALVDKSVIPYHGPYIAKELVISQFKQHGLRLVSETAFIPQRYVLVFKKV